MTKTTASTTPASPELSIVSGIPLAAEPRLGALTLPAYFREVTARYAEREALVMHESDGQVERWSYAQLWDRAMAIARALAACGLGKEERVGVLMTNRPEWVASVFGVALAGGVAVVLSTFATQPELEFMLQVSGVSMLLFERTVLKKNFGAMLQAIEPELERAAPGQLASVKLPFLRRLALVGEQGAGGAVETWAQFLAHGAATSATMIDARAATVTPADPAALFFSSGSTGKPKGILNSHRGVTIQCWRWARMFDLHDDVRTLTANGFFWSGNFGMALGGTLSCGGAIILQATFDPVQALALMQAERVTLPVAWPHQWAALEAAPNWAQVDLSALRYVDQTTPIGRHPTVKRTSYTEPRWAYGNTETFTLTTAFASNTPYEVAGDTHGEPLPGNTIKVVDPLTGAIQPRRKPGEIAVKGPTLMLGYIGVPIDETLDATGFFPTGDGGYIDEKGRLVWQGRLNDIIKTGGANVSPVEVDMEIAGFPGVKHSVTVGVPHETLGELVVACVLPEEGRTLTEGAIRDYLKERLASYKVPRRILFVSDADLSLTGSNKVKTSALRELVAGRLAVAEA
jgi:fatty-acyl-CoA synthase